MLTKWPRMVFHRPRVPMAWPHGQTKRRPTTRPTRRVVPQMPVSRRVKRTHKPKFPNDTFSESALLKLPLLNLQLHRKSWTQTLKTLHPPVAPVAPCAKTQWIRQPAYPMASTRLWILLGKRSKIRPTAQVRSLKDPDCCQTRCSRC